MSEAMIWMAGSLVPAHLATVSVMDRGFTSGDGIFEAIKAVDGQPFALTRHLDRLARSSELIGIDLPPHYDLRAAVLATIAANASRLGALARIRITITAGIAAPGIMRGPSDPTVVITADPQPPHADAATVITVPWPHNDRSMLAGAKTTSYAENLAILEYARAQGAHEALLPDTQGRLCEGTTSNAVVGRNGALITPSLATGCLGGVTRQLIIEWGLAEESDIAITELASCEEVLLSSSTRDLLPVASLDGRSLPAPGPLGAAAIAAFNARAAADMDP